MAAGPSGEFSSLTPPLMQQCSLRTLPGKGRGLNVPRTFITLENIMTVGPFPSTPNYTAAIRKDPTDER
jgi:hypothetical protein